jgi:pimeloyl-ACP methyl ester carboxylesterase
MARAGNSPSPLFRSQSGYEALMAMYEEALAAGPVHYETRFVDSRFGPSHVIIGGPPEAPPLVLFHGWNGNASNIGADFPFVFSGYRVYMPDIVGHPGKSAPARPPIAGSTYSDWACDVLDGLGLERAVVMGISGGGWMTLKLAAHAPERILKGVALSTDGLTPITWTRVLGIAPAAVWPNRTTMRWFVDTATSPEGKIGGRADDFARGLEPILKHFRTQRNPGLLSDDELRRIHRPLLILMGEHERFFDSPRAVARAQALIPGVIAEIVPHAGHVMTIDQPDYLRERVMRFLLQVN